jgi:competence ComEA-like helix-hairpin-helix protein
MAGVPRAAARILDRLIRIFLACPNDWTLTRSADGGFNGFARARSSDCREHRTKEELMNRVRFSMVVLLVMLGSSAPWSAGAAPPSHTGATTTSAPDAAPVNINTADVKELMKLEGVGRRVAEKIVEYRDTHGPFKKPEELRKVEGVGNGLWERNRTRIVIK